MTGQYWGGCFSLTGINLGGAAILSIGTPPTDHLAQEQGLGQNKTAI